MPETIKKKKRFIDLHGKSMQDAFTTTIKNVQEAYMLNEGSLRIVTGKGLHVNASGNRGVILNSFPAWMKNKKLQGMVKEIKLDEHGGAFKIELNEAIVPVKKEKKKKVKFKPQVQVQESGNILYETGRFILNAFSSLFFVPEEKSQPKKKGLKHAA